MVHGCASVIYSRVDPDTEWNVYRVSVSGSAAPEPLVTGPGVEIGGDESPAGGWIKFLSDETGRPELFVQSLAPSRTKLPASIGGVQSAWWSADGKHLFFLKGDQTIWRVSADLNAATPRIGAPEQLGTFPTVVALDLAPSGDRFLALVRNETEWAR